MTNRPLANSYIWLLLMLGLNVQSNSSRFMNWRELVGGGGAIDLAMHLRGLSFTEAVEWLERQFLPAVPAHSANASTATSSGGPGSLSPSSSRPERPLQLPPPVAGKLGQVCRYLIEQRQLRWELIKGLIQRQALYADAFGK